MSEEVKDLNTEQQPTNSTPEEKVGGQGGGKMFTQEDVNRIVAERLAKERAKGTRPAESEVDQRERDLSAREAVLQCQDYLEGLNKNFGRSYPAATLVHLLGASELPQFKDKLREFERVVDDLGKDYNRPPVPKEPLNADSLFRKAFGLSRRKE